MAVELEEKTFAEALGVFDIAIPEGLEADAAVPVISGKPQRQGDVGIFPREALTAGERQSAKAIPREGYDIIRSQTGNSHFLHSDSDQVLYLEKNVGVLMGVLHVPEDTVVYLIHTDEHGANGIGPGTYRVHGKQEQQDELRKVAD